MTTVTTAHLGCPLTWVSEGQKVWAPLPQGADILRGVMMPDVRWLLVEVRVAAGQCARVVNELHGVDAWYVA